MTNEAVHPAPLGVALDAAELEPSRRLAWAALLDVTPASQLGELIAVVAEEDEGVYTLQYTTRLPGYPDWRWNVSLVRLVDQAEPTVLEAELLPGDGALLAPSWVPWSDRLADYEAAQLLETGAVAEGDDEAADSSGEASAPKSSKRIRRTRTRRRIGADGTVDGAAEGEPAEGGSTDAPHGDVDTSADESGRQSPDAKATDDGEKPKKKKRKKDKSAKKAKPEADGGDPTGEQSAGVEVARDGADRDGSDNESTQPAGKAKRSRRKRVDQAAPASPEGEQAPAGEQAADAPGGAVEDSAPEKPERRKRKKAPKKAEPTPDTGSQSEAEAAAPSEASVPAEVSTPRKATKARKARAEETDERAEPKKASGRGKRRRVVVVPRSEDELPAQEAAEFEEAADIREFADDMDDVFDGVDFEPDSDTDSDADSDTATSEA